MNGGIVRWVVLGLTLAAAGAGPVDEQRKVDEDGWIVLFDGSSLDEWVIPEGDGGHWKIVEQDGGKVIDYDARSEASRDKNLRSKREFGDFVLTMEWRIKETPYTNKNVKYVLPDGTNARGTDGNELNLALPDSDSGVYLRDPMGKSQVNIWCWPIGSGEVYGYRTDAKQPAKVREAVTPRHQADRPLGEWNEFVINLVGDRLDVALNGVEVIQGARLPGIPERGPILLQHHGGYNAEKGEYTGPPSLVQFRNIRIKPLDGTKAARRSLLDDLDVRFVGRSKRIEVGLERLGNLAIDLTGDVHLQLDLGDDAEELERMIRDLREQLKALDVDLDIDLSSGTKDIEIGIETLKDRLESLERGKIETLKDRIERDRRTDREDDESPR